MLRPPPLSPLFPYTTLFRSGVVAAFFLFHPPLAQGIYYLLRGLWPLFRMGHSGASTATDIDIWLRSEEHTSELQSLTNLVCRLLLEKKKNTNQTYLSIYF